MIKVRGSTTLTLITGDSFDLSLKANCLDVISKIVFNCPSLGIFRELLFSNGLYVLHLTTAETLNLRLGNSTYSIVLYLKTNGVKTAVFNGVIGVSKGTNVEVSTCDFDYSNSDNDVEVFTETLVPNIFIDLLDIVQVLPLGYLQVSEGLDGHIVGTSSTSYSVSGVSSETQVDEIHNYINHDGAKGFNLYLTDNIQATELIDIIMNLNPAEFDTISITFNNITREFTKEEVITLQSTLEFIPILQYYHLYFIFDFTEVSKKDNLIYISCLNASEFITGVVTLNASDYSFFGDVVFLNKTSIDVSIEQEISLDAVEGKQITVNGSHFKFVDEKARLDNESQDATISDLVRTTGDHTDSITQLTSRVESIVRDMVTTAMMEAYGYSRAEADAVIVTNINNVVTRLTSGLITVMKAKCDINGEQIDVVYAKKEYVQSAIANFVTPEYLASYATKSDLATAVDNVLSSINAILSDYATKLYADSLISGLVTDIQFGRITAMKAKCDQLGNVIDQYYAKKSDCDSNIARLNDQIAQLQTQVSILKARVDSFVPSSTVLEFSSYDENMHKLVVGTTVSDLSISYSNGKVTINSVTSSVNVTDNDGYVIIY